MNGGGMDGKERLAIHHENMFQVSSPDDQDGGFFSMKLSYRIILTLVWVCLSIGHLAQEINDGYYPTKDTIVLGEYNFKHGDGPLKHTPG